ncbi:FecR family protein [Adhaeribacter rhizoryzae]|uniref:DUF4974 domain-containing protein n=1 Tax=Adhaeribacter rhizoryzae TaxID=2607907 RepID=A0A5M6DA89_9BACT|nr:FecR domain-containing protein [Adhaeribacter rhizoryzae]KAA5542889.1 DUF4974 domain-containing protein [Adhaeribacter rhizoryzae]
MEPTDKYKYYAADDFANDEKFWLWVVENDSAQTTFWTNFLRENPGKQVEIEKARELVLSLNQPQNNFSEARVKQLWQRIETTRASLPNPEPARVYSLNNYRRPWFAAAAMITLLLVSGALYWFWLKNPTPVTLATTFGERKEFRLPDGSKILLNANSNIRYYDNWGSDQDREVWLTGEGFFSIQPKQNKQKFIVHAGKVNIKVLGTTFNVNHRRQAVKVLLQTGKISLGLKNAEKPLLLKPGDFVTYHQGTTFTRETVDPEHYLAWKNNLLSFKAESLENIFQLLRDNYNLQITTEDLGILQRKFTGTVPADDLSVLFLGLQDGYNLNIKQEGNNILIKSKTPAPDLPATK